MRSTPFSPRPTQMTRGYNTAVTSTTTFVYDDFGELIETTVPEAGAPGAAAPTRYEYDVGGRLVLRRLGTGTASVRTDQLTYDSLGRLLSVDNDKDHVPNCAVAGTPIQDEDYKYDDCSGSDVPAGFTCSHAIGRRTIARASVQCGTGSVIVKRGRWYDYDGFGRVSRIAYATVTGSTIGTPAIMDYSYTAADRLLQYRSPLNTSYGTKYLRDSSGRISELDTSASTPAMIANGISYQAFGPVASLATAVVQPAGGGVNRTLTYGGVYRTDGVLNNVSWSLAAPIGSGVSSIALINQNLSYTPAGLISYRYDFADFEARRYYGYDSLLRLTCEARGQSSPPITPDAVNCTQSSSLAAGLFTYGNGESATSPPDVRATSFVRSESSTYVSPSTETSTYVSGSGQVQQINRSTSSLVIGYDGLGRRSYEYDSFDITRSRRDYTYLPNGQLGTITGHDSSNNTVATAIRYDEAGRLVTVAESVNNAARDSYELFWDDADRLIATNIVFASSRPCAAHWVVIHGVGHYVADNCTGVRWHYHYLGQTLIAATRETLGYSTVKRFWAVADERGLVYRLLDSTGATYWQARWDASGWRNSVGTAQAEMWVAFGLPGQILLAKHIVGSSVDFENGLITAEQWGSEAYASGTGGTWTRPPIALNQWRAYDPLAGGFLQPDTADMQSRLLPEGYTYGRSSVPNASDSTGRTTWSDCNYGQYNVWQGAIAAAYMDIVKCTHGECGFPGGESVRREWLSRILSTDQIVCVNGAGKYIDFDYEDGSFRIRGLNNRWAYARTTFSEKFGATTWLAYFSNPQADCPKQIVAHEALETANRHLPGSVVNSNLDTTLNLREILGMNAYRYRWKFSPWNYDENGGIEGEESWVNETVNTCVKCDGSDWPQTTARDPGVVPGL